MYAIFISACAFCPRLFSISSHHEKASLEKEEEEKKSLEIHSQFIAIQIWFVWENCCKNCLLKDDVENDIHEE
jgi:hypothetical protein